MAESLLTDLDDSPASIPSGTVTFLFTDIQGSTQLLERLREQYALVLAEQRDVLRAIFAEWNGHEIDTQGDAFFVAFPRALDAVNCAIQAQRALAAHTWPQNVQVYVRMGLHTGEPIIARTGYVGMDVHLAARIGAAGHGGQILLSKTTRELVYADLPHGVSLRDLGEHKLKDIRHPQKIYQIEIEGLNVEFPSLKTLATGEEPPTPGNPPFKGMQFFDEADADLFFGRETMTRQLIERIQAQRFLAIIGASGSGKSSVVRAGVVPLLKRQQADHWHIHVITPTSHPLEALAASLTHGIESVTATTTLIDDLAHDQRSLHLYVRKSSPAARFLIVVDQFEELFTLCRNEAERQAFVDNLLYAQATDGSNDTTIVVVLRADFYEHLAQYATLREAVAKHQEYLGPMSAEELRQAIEEPAKGGGWEFSPGLVDLMLHDVGATADNQPEPGALPLLSHALLETWRRRRGNVMTLKGYSESGGVRGAIARTAETVYYTELNAEQRLIARSIFLRLTELGEGTQDTRRRASLEELFPPASFATPAQVEEVVVKLADARLITTGEGTVEVAHEALIREWTTLREWLTQNREGLRLHRHLTEAAQEWELLERDPSALYRGIRLVQALEWAEANPRELNAQEQNFLDASKELAMREETERKARQQRELEAAQKLAETEKRAASNLRRRAVYLSGALIVAAVLAIVALIFGQQSNNNAQQAQVHLAGAQTAEARAVAEAQVRATAEANAVAQRQEALRQASIGLASQAIAELQGTAPERGVLLALEALENYPYTGQAENALAQAVEESRPYVNLATDYGETILSSVAWSSGGKLLAGGYAEFRGNVIIWDVNANVEINRLLEAGGGTRECGILDMDWSPNGDRLVLVSGNPNTPLNGTICDPPKIWNVKTNTQVLTLTTLLSETTSVDWSNDGQHLLTSHIDGTVRIWDAQLGAELGVLSGHAAAVRDAAWSPNGDLVVSASDDRTAKVWDAHIGKELITLTGHAGSVRAVCWSPDGKYIATASADGTGRVWNSANGEILYGLVGHTAGLIDIDWSADGETIVTSSQDGSSRAWDAKNGTSLFKLPGQTSELSKFAWSPTEEHLAMAGAILPHLWDMSQQSPRLPPVHMDWTFDARWSPNGQRIATMSFDRTARIWDATSMKELLLLEHPTWVFFSAWSPDSKLLVTSNYDGFSRIWDAVTGKLLLEHRPEVKISAEDFSVAEGWSPDGSRIATTYRPSNLVEVWNATTGKTLFIFGDGSCSTWWPEWSPQGDRFAGGCQYTAADDNTPLSIWDGQTGQLLMTLESHDGESNNGAWSPDGTRLAVTYEKGPVKVWDTATGKELLTFGGHNAWVAGIAWSPNGTRIASSDEDGNIKVWDAITGQEVMVIKAPGSGRSLAWSPDGRYLLASGTYNTPIIKRVWQSTAELIQYAKQCCVVRELTAAERQQFGLAPK